LLEFSGKIFDFKDLVLWILSTILSISVTTLLTESFGIMFSNASNISFKTKRDQTTRWQKGSSENKVKSTFVKYKPNNLSIDSRPRATLK